MEMLVIYIIISLLIGFTLGYFIANNNSQKLLDLHEKTSTRDKEFENAFKAIASDITKSNTDEFIKQANDKFQTLSKESDTNLENKKKLIDQNLEEMSKKLASIEKESTKLNANLEDSKMETQNLRDTTTKLREILSSSQKRGQWGERMVEDILNFIGLIEGVNYTKQDTVESGERPDFTFKLPKEKVINMDVKFPLSHYENYIETDDEFVMKNEKKEFLKSVRNHIKAISNRNYIDTSSGTLDYVLMFIPNESIYSFINQEDSSIIDYALTNKVLICSPLTLYAILSLINQATRNFAVEEKALDVMKLLSKFKEQWEKYSGTIDKMGRSIETVQKDYLQLVTTRKNQLEKPLNEIESLTGQLENTSIDKLDGQQKF
ncbi:MAG: DNA recombination protein RmuC [Methanobacteriota archaeon]|jgi:DNA recombination protein RmuC|nr:MAG: DNA recombination protein RmuC [Euryarchaeota archaeon]